ncbi:MAG: LicD family protein [Muribaculum sp.]|nr:LicD family protein [Muribaculum sp.]
MLYFPEEYFQPEVREDFLIDTTMKTVWAAEMELLSDIDAVCQKYNLQYYAYWGTLLGAVRHQGFVPWDDDMDLIMKRKDYNVLMQVLPKELPETYRVYDALLGEGHDQYWGFVANADTISSKAERLRKFHGCPFWVGIDIVPLDCIPRNPGEAQLLHSLMTLIWKAVYLTKQTDKTPKDERDLEDTLAFLEGKLNTRFDQKKPLANQLWRLGSLLATSYGEEDGDLLTVHSSEVKNPGVGFRKELWDSVIGAPFETITIPIPGGYDEILRILYGDYNVRVRDLSEHDYPYYKKQLQQLRDMVSKMEGNADTHADSREGGT